MSNVVADAKQVGKESPLIEVVGGLRLLSDEQTAQTLGVTRGTLAVWRCTKRYPLPFVRIGRKIRYRQDDILKFIESRTSSGVSDSGVSRAKRRRTAA
jgi:predicted DNA-binding transcriptional regulator AlpA